MKQAAITQYLVRRKANVVRRAVLLVEPQSTSHPFYLSFHFNAEQLMLT